MIKVEYRRALCIVVNKYKEEYDVNIQRGTIWGNPYKIGLDGQTREEVIEKYKKYFHSLILSGIITRDHLMTLRRMRLGCTCPEGKSCHGHVIADLVNKTFKDPQSKLSEFLEV